MDSGTYIALPLLTAIATVLVNRLDRWVRKELPRRRKRRRRLLAMPDFGPPAPFSFSRRKAHDIAAEHAAAVAVYKQVHSRCIFGGVHQHFKSIRGENRRSAIAQFFRNWDRSGSGSWRADRRLASPRVHPRRRCPPVQGSAFFADYEAERAAAAEEWSALKRAKTSRSASHGILPSSEIFAPPVAAFDPHGAALESIARDVSYMRQQHERDVSAARRPAGEDAPRDPQIT